MKVETTTSDGRTTHHITAASLDEARREAFRLLGDSQMVSCQVVRNSLETRMTLITEPAQ